MAHFKGAMQTGLFAGHFGGLVAGLVIGALSNHGYDKQ